MWRVNLWSRYGHEFNPFHDGELDVLSWTPDEVFLVGTDHLHKSSIVDRLQEGVGPNVENIAAMAGILS